MAITKHDAPLATSPATFISQALDYINALVRDKEPIERIEGGYIKQGARFSIGNVLYIADADTAISGTPGATTLAVKLTPSGTTAAPSYVTSLTGVTWNAAYQGYYDGSGNLYLMLPSVGDYVQNEGEQASEIVSSSNNVTKEIKIEKSGAYRNTWVTGFATGGSSSINVTITSQIYRNGVLYGTLHTSTWYAPSGSERIAEDLWFERGDVIKIVWGTSQTTISTCSSLQLCTSGYGTKYS